MEKHRIMKKYAIIVAGGSGTRFGSAMPKQFLPLAGVPVLMHTVRKFAYAGASVVLVLPAAQRELWAELCAKHHFEVECTVVCGGSSRFESVKNGLAAVETLAATGNNLCGAEKCCGGARWSATAGVGKGDRKSLRRSRALWKCRACGAGY